MTETEFRKRFGADQRAGALTWITAGAIGSAIALGLDGPKTILARNHRTGTIRVTMADARFVDA